MDEPREAERHAILSGRVQGVAFRWYARERGSELGLRGWVRNLPDGRVETRFAGPPEAVRAFEDWLASGPPSAHVEELALDEPGPGLPESAGDGFRILH